jgi:hypothetical protein
MFRNHLNAESVAKFHAMPWGRPGQVFVQDSSECIVRRAADDDKKPGAHAARVETSQRRKRGVYHRDHPRSDPTDLGLTEF